MYQPTYAETLLDRIRNDSAEAIAALYETYGMRPLRYHPGRFDVHWTRLNRDEPTAMDGPAILAWDIMTKDGDPQDACALCRVLDNGKNPDFIAFDDGYREFGHECGPIDLYEKGRRVYQIAKAAWDAKEGRNA